MPFTSLSAVEAYLEQIPKFKSVGSSGADFNLERFKSFCESIGDPQDKFSSIHVAGTNGKGSTCRLLESVYRHAECKVGVYTSPHIHRFTERFIVNGNEISEDELTLFFNSFRENIEKYKLTYFEISTAIAFWWFARAKVDLGIIEVGLGGRLDATNVISPLVSVITSISLDHTDILGETIHEIAYEKAGIIKSETPVVTGDLPEEAQEKVLQIAQQKGSSVNKIDNLQPRSRGQGVYQISTEQKEITFDTSLLAPVQSKNIAIAWQVVQLLDRHFPISCEEFKKGINSAELGLGRFNRLLESQQWYFDGGHNLEAVRALKQAVCRVGDLEETTLVLSLLEDKVRPKIMEEFSEFRNIYYYQLSLERAASFDDIKQWLPQVTPFSDKHRQTLFNNDFNSELVIFAGSFYFYATVREWVQDLYNR
ncbi:bifunctional folylpolyglutamate synthase/dihydrofolate synthase [Fodinibius halophilus]|uniref:tetrahydrofolate synthase n=1 Tax=Fodinibius halophilus TaxID=1736908 RepID=A0A6M1T3S3_9BACT|nr:folylpolyglutamate synthase/dihydrofolate synthase family protein [Fodinibius halophilus]NGP87865.1 bifunctional folylpolyglutamate synthase/dihydrofolate synthase [Fodinibius halophilus]